MKNKGCFVSLIGLLIVPLSIYIIYRLGYQKTQAFYSNQMQGRYVLDIGRTRLGNYDKEREHFRNLKLEIKENRWYLDGSVPFIHDSNGTWKPAGSTEGEWNELYSGKEELYLSQFTELYRDSSDSIFYMQGTAPKRGNEPISAIYFKKIQ